MLQIIPLEHVCLGGLPRRSGSMYLKGEKGVPKDPEQAMTYLQMAADDGDG